MFFPRKKALFALDDVRQSLYFMTYLPTYLLALSVVSILAHLSLRISFAHMACGTHILPFTRTKEASWFIFAACRNVSGCKIRGGHFRSCFAVSKKAIAAENIIYGGERVACRHHFAAKHRGTTMGAQTYNLLVLVLLVASQQAICLETVIPFNFKTNYRAIKNIKVLNFSAWGNRGESETLAGQFGKAPLDKETLLLGGRGIVSCWKIIFLHACCILFYRDLTPDQREQMFFTRFDVDRQITVECEKAMKE